MEENAKKLHETIKDYRNDEGISITEQHIIDWANQFGEDNKFILSEVAHIIPQTYISKIRAKSLIKKHIEYLIKKYQYSTIQQFLMDVDFLDLQPSHKSQSAILKILEEPVVH